MSALGQPRTGSLACPDHDVPCPACTLRYRALIRGLEDALEAKRVLLEQVLDEASRLRNANTLLRAGRPAPMVPRVVPVAVDPVGAAVAEAATVGRL